MKGGGFYKLSFKKIENNGKLDNFDKWMWFYVIS